MSFISVSEGLQDMRRWYGSCFIYHEEQAGPSIRYLAGCRSHE